MPFMTEREKAGLSRLLVGLAFNLGLGFVCRELMYWSSYERELRLHLIGACLTTFALVVLVPVFWKGAPSHAPIAFVLLWLPLYIILSILILSFAPSH